MKISMIGPVYPYRGGIAHYTTLLAQKLQAAGHAVQVISFRRQYPAWLYPGETDRDTSREPMTITADFVLDPLYPWTWTAAAKKIAQSGPDLVIVHWWTTFWAPALAVVARLLRKKNLRVVYLIHNVMPHEARVWDRWLSFFALSPAQAYIAQTEKEADRLRALIAKAKIVVTPHPVYDMFSETRLSGEEARKKLNLPLQAPVALFFGIVRPYKGLRYLLQAFKKMEADCSSAHLIISGEFWEPVGAYQEMISQLGLVERVHIFNHYIPNEDIPLYFRAANLFVAPYIDGTQSGSAKLAMGFSLPMVLTNCIVDETLANQNNVWRVAEKDVDDLAHAMTDALKNGRPGEPSKISDDWKRVVRTIEGL